MDSINPNTSILLGQIHVDGGHIKIGTYQVEWAALMSCHPSNRGQVIVATRCLEVIYDTQSNEDFDSILHCDKSDDESHNKIVESMKMISRIWPLEYEIVRGVIFDRESAVKVVSSFLHEAGSSKHWSKNFTKRKVLSHHAFVASRSNVNTIIENEPNGGERSMLIYNLPSFYALDI